MPFTSCWKSYRGPTELRNISPVQAYILAATVCFEKNEPFGDGYTALTFWRGMRATIPFGAAEVCGSVGRLGLRDDL